MFLYFFFVNKLQNKKNHANLNFIDVSYKHNSTKVTRPLYFILFLASVQQMRSKIF